MKNEVWKDVIGFEGYYQVSNFGRVKSLRRYVYRCGNQYLHKEKLLSPCMDQCGYLHVHLSKDGSLILFKVHRLVAKHFLDTYSESLTVNHINHDKWDNNVSNLEMMSLQENIKDTLAYSNIYRCEETGEEFKQPKRYFNSKGLPYSKYRFLKSLRSGDKYNDLTFTVTMVKRENVNL